jgi:flagellin
MNIRLRIPQTTMDHLFGYQAGTRDLSEFNVLTAKSREELLGNRAGKSRSGRIIPKDEKGLLDTAIDYLTNANTLIGAQNMRLGMTESNIVVQQENTTASESTIRDADMAKEMAEYTKASVLMQASQSMLAQANQNGSQVLGLLQ